jgi:hypothetical protein
MSLRTLYLFALIFAAAALVPAGAHLSEHLSKMRLDAEEYRIVQQIYRGWSLLQSASAGTQGRSAPP